MKNNLLEEPEILDLANARDKKRIQTLKKNPFTKVVDEFEEQKRELFYVQHPKDLLSGTKKGFSYTASEGKWIYLPWKSALVHILDKNDFQKLRTSRNHDLITPSEQKKFSTIRVGIAGLNVGNPAAICLALEGGGNDMKFADHDGLSVSNLNRFRAGIAELGLNKVFISARQVYEINPYATLALYEHGISLENINEFLFRPKLDVLVEEMDNLPLKILIRERARAFRIPVVMATGSGPDVVIDVERYDLDPKLPILNGYLKKNVIDPVTSGTIKNFSFPQKMALARDFMGEKFLHPRLVTSFPQVGKTLAGIPQLAESSFLRGGAVTYAIRQITTGRKMESGRYILKLDGLKKL
jgi:tRNA A37 threonylcarbamoyladenosine dehydratase